ncbi:MAG: hypothetical protein Q8L14_21685 [Myxococcales bacterium]|nr:hypothetical protein [Myxococcales bacterium]
MRLLTLLVVTACSSGCALFIEGLEPRPNIPPVTDPAPITITLAPEVKQEQSLELSNGATLEVRSFRGDIKRGFLAGFPGATQQKAPLSIALLTVEPSYENLNVAGIARLRFRGTVDSADGTLMSFAGKVESPICANSISSCFTTAIEAMFERIYAELAKLKTAPKPAPPPTPTET